MGFRENLKEIMDYKDLTLKELSFMTGIPKGSLSNYLKENCSIPSADIAVQIASALNVSVEYLITGNTQNKEKIFPYSNEIEKMASTVSKFTPEKKQIVIDLVENLQKI